jgi:N6-adenosine-specific RNA methylase IME4
MKFHAVTDIFPMMSHDEFAALVADIKGSVLHEPIWTWQGAIIDGRNRFLACQEAGVEPRYREWNGKGDLIRFVVSQNLHRRHLNESQRAMSAARLANMRQGERTDLAPSANLPKVSQVAAAEQLKVGDRTVRDAKKVIEEGVPELAKAVDEGKVAVSAAAGLLQLSAEDQKEIVAMVNREEAKSVTDARRKMAKRKMRDNPEMPDGTYRVIYADPPWDYGNHGLDQYGPAERHYPVMTTQAICAMGDKVKAMASDNSVLFLWSTSPMLPQALKVMDAFGFDYKSSFVWYKVKHNFGYYNSVRHEILLIGTRGKCMPDIDKKINSVQIIERSKRHSEKPEEFRKIIEELYPYGKRIELFARATHSNWTSWGNEILDDAAIDAEPSGDAVSTSKVHRNQNGGRDKPSAEAGVPSEHSGALVRRSYKRVNPLPRLGRARARTARTGERSRSVRDKAG